MKRQQMLTMVEQIRKLGETKNTKLALTLLKSINQLQELLQPVDDLQQKVNSTLGPKLREYEAQRLDLCRSFAKTDDNGIHIIITENEVDQYDISDKDAFNKALDALRLEYKTEFDAHKDFQKQIVGLLNEDMNIDSLKINVDDLPIDMSLLDLEPIQGLLQ